MVGEMYYNDDAVKEMMRRTVESIRARVQKEADRTVSVEEIARYYVNFKFKRFEKKVIGYELRYEEIELCYFFLGRHWWWRYRDIPFCRFFYNGNGRIKVDSLDAVFEWIVQEESEKLVRKT